jgi:hypothetical protein
MNESPVTSNFYKGESLAQGLLFMASGIEERARQFPRDHHVVSLFGETLVIEWWDVSEFTATLRQMATIEEQ